MLGAESKNPAPHSEAKTECEAETHDRKRHRGLRPRTDGRDLAVDGRGAHRCWAAADLGTEELGLFRDARTDMPEKRIMIGLSFPVTEPRGQEYWEPAHEVGLRPRTQKGRKLPIHHLEVDAKVASAAGRYDAEREEDQKDLISIAMGLQG